MLAGAWALLMACYHETEQVGLRLKFHDKDIGETVTVTLHLEINQMDSVERALEEILFKLGSTEAERQVRNESVSFDLVADGTINFMPESGSGGQIGGSYHSIVLQCRRQAKGTLMSLVWTSPRVQQRRVVRIAHQLDQVVSQFGKANLNHFLLADVRTASAQDLNELRSWNADVPVREEACVHEIIAQTVRRQPEAEAVCAWDGSLKYRQLDEYATRLAVKLVSVGVRPKSIVALCFEKSVWTPVAMLGVMKAGGASVVMDVVQPRDRLKAIVEQASPLVILTSTANRELANYLVDDRPVVIVDAPTLHQMNQAQQPLPRVSPSDWLYIAFTSGSTGNPKGSIITHSNWASAIANQTAKLGFDSTSRVFDYVSYAFDVAWSNVLHSFAAGSCLCIPSEDLKHDLAQSMFNLRVNYAHLTPTIARFMQGVRIPKLKLLNCSGEPLLREDVAEWQGASVFINTYGPAECTPTSTMALMQSAEGQPPIGKALGCRAWVVEPRAGKDLVAIGAVGELWLEGPQVGEGYLNDPTATLAAFVTDPDWLMRCVGRSGRVYKTGDLVRYDFNGDLTFVGRKDAQVKIRGQRVELEEIDQHMRHALTVKCQVVADVIVPQGSDDPSLVAFISVPIERNGAFTSRDTTRLMEEAVAEIEEKLPLLVPAYMIPTAYIPIERIPTATTGKIDRRKLREYGTTWTRTDLVALYTSRNKTRRKPQSETERQLQALWAGVLNMKPNQISASDSFLRLGGDSIKAIRLVQMARRQGWSMTVANVVQRPRLSDLATVVAKVDTRPTQVMKPFVMLVDPDGKDVRTQIADLCQLKVEQIEDGYPCTPLQQGLLALTERRSGDNITQKVLELQNTVDCERFKKAWARLLRTTPILRTRIVDLPGQGLVHALVTAEEQPTWNEGEVLESVLAEDKQLSMGLGTPLTRQSLVRAENANYFIWTIHHALYDGWLLPRIYNELEELYLGEHNGLGLMPFQHFIQYTAEIDRDAATTYWKGQFEGLEVQHFPTLPSPTYQPMSDSVLEFQVDGVDWGKDDFTPSTIVRSAWAIVMAQYGDSRSGVFGATVTGRQASMPGIENVGGPTIATVPLRVAIDWDEDVEQLLRQVQTQGVEMILFEQMGLRWIGHLSKEAEHACQFQTLLVIQQEEAETSQALLFDLKPENLVESLEEMKNFNAYAMLIECSLQLQQVQLRVSFDSFVIASEQVMRMMQQMSCILRQFCSQKNRNLTLSDVQTISDQDLHDIWTWNAPVPVSEVADIPVHELIARTAKEVPEKIAVCAWDGSLTYGQLEELSTRLARRLTSIGVGRGVVVPLCFEKSLWTPVAMSGVMKAGGASVATDCTQPEGRLRTIVGQAQPKVVLTSRANERLATRISDRPVLVVDTQELAQMCEDCPLPTVLPSDNVCVVFTSGSTGVPKGVALSHRNFAYAMEAQSGAFGILPNSRVFDFVSYSFDFAWSNYLLSAYSGACLCIPSEHDRRNNITQSMRSFGVTFSCFTPAVAKTLDLSEVPTLKCLVIGGEPLAPQDLQGWTEAIRLIPVYGPTESTVIATTADLRVIGGQFTIGVGLATNTWIVSPQNDDTLSAVGTIGELWLEGPLVAKGYLNDVSKTAAAFIEDPSWLLRGSSGHPGRRGRVYRTGDLVRYNTHDGSLVFVGRKDTQVKIRGQRVELRETEQYILQSLTNAQVVAEVILPQGSQNPTLVAFIRPSFREPLSETELAAMVEEMVVGLDDKLANILPAYMVPTMYLPVNQFPLTTTGKIDRRQLREVGSTSYWRGLAAVNRRQRKLPSNDLESTMLTCGQRCSILPRKKSQQIQYLLGWEEIRSPQCRLCPVAGVRR